jgi:hypothetical protein
MKKITAAMLVALLAAMLNALLTAGAAFAQELDVSGEVKTGFYAEQETIGNLDPRNYSIMKNNDGNSGSGAGRLRMDFHFAIQNAGLRVRFQVDAGAGGASTPLFNYAYAYSNLLNGQITLSAGILGDSPWGTGGPELLRYLETRETIGRDSRNGDIYIQTSGLLGIRFEYKPSFLPGLNMGFTLNQPDTTAGQSTEQTFAQLLGESIVGAMYEHEYFAGGVGYRFDSEMDKAWSKGPDEGGRLAYRLEERVLKTFASGMQVSLNGYYYGLGSEQFEQNVGTSASPVIVKLGSGEYFTNWLYWLWDTDNYIARFDTCLAMNKTYFNQALSPALRQDYKSLSFRPAFYYKFFNNIFQAGLSLGFGMEFGPGRINTDSTYQYISVEPQIKLNLGSNAYFAFVYNFTDKYAHPEINVGEGIKLGDKSQRHWINLRAVYTF